MSKTIMVNTFTPPPNAHGENGPEYVGNLRRGELRGVIKINKDNCVGCDTCRKVCPVHAISGGLGVVHSIREDACLSCGQCLIACPFNAIEQMSFVDEVMKMLDDPNKLVVAHPSPAVRVSVGEEFGAKAGELVTEQFVNALEKAGFTTYDVNQTADQTIMEEGFEFINKIRYWVLGEECGNLPPRFIAAFVYGQEPDSNGWSDRQDLGCRICLEERSPRHLCRRRNALHGQDL